ncbi:MAG: hypothetical protein AUI17_06835 [Acidobacteriales bacterium 13_2_20CM_2_55_5]|nr:MAG: hypothetical protein AUI17_06835 [Acidobacteriales bacterium 13_2_20CM_2_55_5]
MARTMTRHQPDSVVYLYGVTRPPVSNPPQVPGVDGESKIEALDCAGLICWVSRFPAEDFGENLSRKLEDLDWLAAVSVRHQRAVASIADKQDMLPARLGTVFLSDSSLQDDISKRKAVLETDFSRIQGSEEWGVKVFVLPARVNLPPKVRTGKEYLQAKSSLLQSRTPPKADEDVKRFAYELDQLGVATAEGGKISGGRRDLQYQVSVLVKRADRTKLQNLLRRFSRDWKDKRKIEITGPWPPYSFVSRESESKS